MNDEKINDILGLDPSENEKSMVTTESFKPPVERKEGEKDIDVDYDYSRDSYYNLIEKGNEAIQGILDIAKEGQHPRAYEVAGQLIGQVAQTVDKLQDLQKKLKDLKEVPGKTTANIKNALFVGSTNELQKMLNRKDNEVIEGESGTPEQNNTGNK